jgi:excisionase family DNA binding protein
MYSIMRSSRRGTEFIMAFIRVTSVPDAAQRLNLSTAMVRRYCQEGRIEAKKVGRDWLITERSLIDFARQPRKVGRPKKVSE